MVSCIAAVPKIVQTANDYPCSLMIFFHVFVGNVLFVNTEKWANLRYQIKETCPSRHFDPSFQHQKTAPAELPRDGLHVAHECGATESTHRLA